MLPADDQPPPPPWYASAPPAFMMSVACTVIVGALFSFLVTYGLDDSGSLNSAGGWLHEFIRYGRPMLSPGFALAAASLSMLGFAELVRRAGPGPDGLILRVGWCAALVFVGSVLAGLYMNHWYAPRADARDLRDILEMFWKWQQRVGATAALVASGSLLLAGRRNPLVMGMAMPFLIATAFCFPYEMVWELTHETGSWGGDRWVATFIDVAIDVSFAVCLLMVTSALGRQLPPAPVDLARAGVGLQRVGSALVARVLVIVVAAFTMVSTFASSSLGLAKLITIVFPLGLLIASIALVTGMFQSGGLTAPGAPRKRLYAAAVFTTVALIAEGLKALAIYRSLPSQSDQWNGYAADTDRILAALPYATPALGLAGMLCLLSGVQALRRWVPQARIDETSIAGAAVSVSVFTVAAVVMLRWGASSPRDLGAYVVVAILVAIFNVIAQLSVARACHRVAEAMLEAPGLPTAVVASKS
jgi:hypothetical protein